MQYRIKSAIWMCEEDSWDNGCLPDTSKSKFSELSIKAHTLDNLLSELYRQTNSTKADCLFNACGEIGRIDIQWNSSKPFSFFRISKSTTVEWRNGGINAWLNDFSVYVEKIEPVDFFPLV